MRFLIEVAGQLDVWHRTLVATVDQPRLPLPFSCLAAFVQAGHKVSAIHLSDESLDAANQGAFVNIYGPHDLPRALFENDIAFFWAGSGIKAIAANLRHSYSQRKVLLGSYVWRLPRGMNWKIRGLALATRLAARYARGVVLMTDEQLSQATESLPAKVPVRLFTWGIDSAFYRATTAEADLLPEVREKLPALLQAPYVILAGDQQRLDEDAVALVERFNVRLVRVPQERETAAWYDRQISERRLEGRLFVFERVPYPTLRFLLQHAAAYVGLVDSTWQPAGWTVLCEALASGTPAVIYDGLTAREMRRLGARDYLTVVPFREVGAMSEACEEIGARGKNAFKVPAMTFAQNDLDLERTGICFVKKVEEMSRI